MIALLLAASGLLTPPPGPAPHINAPKIYGARPGKPFLYRIPCTGARPIEFTAKNLPPGIQLDAKTGILSGTTPAEKREFAITLQAKNSHGKHTRVFRLQVGDTLALTPPMGWNHWYTHYCRVTDATIRRAADAMISSGMADFGYEFVSIDDCWMEDPGPNARDSAGLPKSNSKFPDMKGLADYIHSKGLKAGIYTSPGPTTCQKLEGAWQHESIDAKTFAAWGYDLLKYDWCGYGKIVPKPTLADSRKPYELMGSLLSAQPRDIQLNLCQYGRNDVWKWGAEVGGHSWRTTGDLGLERDTELPGFYSIAFKNMVLTGHAGPGHWNDPDYILIGWYGNAHGQAEPQKAKLTPDEQYSYMSLWSLMAAPLFFSGDMEKLDEFTLNVLCNTEIIDINQDILGKQAKVIRKTNEELVLAKPLEGGAMAVGLFNLSKEPRKIPVTWSELGLHGIYKSRDPWRHKNQGPSSSKAEAPVPAHGVQLLRLSR
ncbi:MAG: alpha-galactosidase [Bryobacterales bacterium]|nr:alpha-galactosidase [Bryobacterales bacterium]